MKIPFLSEKKAIDHQFSTFNHLYLKTSDMTVYFAGSLRAEVNPQGQAKVFNDCGG